MSDFLGINLRAGIDVGQSTTQIQEQIKKIQDVLKPLNINIDDKTLAEAISKTFKVAEDGSLKLEQNILKITTEEGKLVQITQAYNKEMNQLALSSVKVNDNLKAQALEVEKISNAMSRQNFDSFNKSIGIGTTSSNSAKDASLAFQQIFAEEDKALGIQKAKSKNFWDTFNQSVGIGISSSEPAKNIASTFNSIFAEEDRAIIVQKAKMQQFWSGFNQSVGIGTTSSNKASTSAGAFEELFNKSEKTTAGMNKLEKQIVSLNPKIETMNHGMDMSSQSISGMITKFAEWYLIGGAVSALFGELGKSIKFINDLNKSMTNISMITGLSHEKVVEMTNDYVNLSAQLHDTISNVSKASEEFLRAGHTQDETLSLIKSSTVMSKIAGEDQKVTADQLIAITNGFGIEASKTMEIVDKLTTVDNNSATSTKELGLALERTSASAQMAGVKICPLR